MYINITNVSTTIKYIEDNLSDKLDLEIIANAVHYSKYHLHHVFKNTIGMTIWDYVQRRKLTEAAKLLVFSDKAILEIALLAGYESQQSFTTAFKQMYKKSPNQYREAEVFYPLQLKFNLNSQPTKVTTEINWKEDIEYATEIDIPEWMNLVYLVIDGFPYLNEEEYLVHLRESINKKEALIIRDQDIIIGAMGFDKISGSIKFLGVHPQYRKQEIAKAFIQKIIDEVVEDYISITTFREGDKADIGYREMFKNLGFAEAELLIEFGYPIQKLVKMKSNSKSDING